MAETKQERRESWKQRTTKTATALRKAKATVTTGGKRSIPLSARTPSEIRVAAFRAEHPERTVVDPVTGKHTRIDTRPVGIGAIGAPSPMTTTQRERDLDNMRGMYVTPMGPEQEARLSMLRSQHEARRVQPEPTYTPEAVSAYTGVPTDRYVPSPYKPETRPEDVEYGDVSKLQRAGAEPQIHDILGSKLRQLDDMLGERRRKMDIAISGKLPDISTESEVLQEKYGEFKEAPVTTIRDIGVDASMLIGGSAVLSGVAKVGILGARHVTKYGAKKVVKKIPDTDVGKLIQKAVMGTEKVIEPAVGAVFGYYAIKDIATTPKEEIPHKLYEYGLGFYGASKGYRAPEKGIDIFRTRGKIEVPPEAIIDPGVLAGKDPFPYVKRGESVPELITRFERTQLELPTIREEGALVMHATSKPMPKDVTIAKGETRPSDISGLYVAPSKHASTHFLHTGQIKPKDMPKQSYLSRLFGEPESLTPTLLGIDVPGVGRIPKTFQSTVELSRFYMNIAEKGRTRISRDVELAQKSHGKVEAEALVPPGTKMKQYSADHYVMVGDRKVPIDLYYAAKGKKLKDMTKQELAEVRKQRAEEGIKYDPFAKEIPKGPKPDPYYYIPKRPRKYKPYYRTDVTPSSVKPRISEAIKPSKSYIPAAVSSYVPLPSESYIPKPSDSYITPPSESYIPLPSESYVPPPSKSYVVPPPEEYIPPVSIPGKPTIEKKPGVIKDKRMAPGYAWQLANPIATLEQLMGGGRTQRTSSRTSRKKSTTHRRRK